MFKSIEAREGGIELVYNGHEIEWTCQMGDVKVVVYEVRAGSYDPNLIIGPKHSSRYWMSPPERGSYYVILLENHMFRDNARDDASVRVVISLISDMGQAPKTVFTSKNTIKSNGHLVLGGHGDQVEVSERIDEVTSMNLPSHGRLLIAVYKKPPAFLSADMLQKMHGPNWRKKTEDSFRVLTDDGLELAKVATIHWRDDVKLKVEWPETESE